MNQEIKKKWVDALRSGEYQKGVGNLNWGGAFCCLGVLCDIHSKETGTKWEDSGKYIDSHSYLPDQVMGWAELPRSQFGADVMRQSVRLSLVSLNDAGVTFREIADLIEAQL